MNRKQTSEATTYGELPTAVRYVKTGRGGGRHLS